MEDRIKYIAAAIAYMTAWRDGSTATEEEKQEALVALIRADK